MGLDEYKIADLVSFRRGAGWQKGVVSREGCSHLVIEYQKNSNTTFVTIHDHRNVKHQPVHLKGGSDRAASEVSRPEGEVQPSLW
jgi:hypothetical protein